MAGRTVGRWVRDCVCICGDPGGQNSVHWDRLHYRGGGASCCTLRIPAGDWAASATTRSHAIHEYPQQQRSLYQHKEILVVKGRSWHPTPRRC